LALDIDNEVFGFFNGSERFFIQRERCEPPTSWGSKLTR
jgi:hypothetical protein